MSEYSVKAFLILLMCSGLLSLFAGTYLKISAIKRSSDPGRVRTLAYKYLWRGISAEVLSLVAYVLFIRGVISSWVILLALAAVLLGIEFFIERGQKPNVSVSER